MPWTTGRACFWCGDESLDVAWWRDASNGDGWVGYRPACDRCLCDTPGVCSARCRCRHRRDAAVVACDACGGDMAYTDPCPPRRGTWRAFWNVCSLACLNEIESTTPRPAPGPRPCEACGDDFQPRARSTARFCSARCRQANHRHREPFDLADALARLGVDLDHPGHPAQRWDRQAFARALEQLHPDDLPLGSRSDRP